MDAAVYRPAQAERGKLVSSSPDARPGSAEGDSRLLAEGTPNTLGVEDGYRRWAHTYDSFPNPLLAREERYLLPLLPDLSSKTTLDLACGTGRWLEHLVAKGSQLAVGVDLSTAMLTVAGRKPSIQGRLANADSLNLPFRPAVFDFAVCSFAVSHIEDRRRMAAELARVMRHQSELFVTDLHPDAWARGWRTGFREGAQTLEIQAAPATAEALMRIFHAAGFECLTQVSLCLGAAEKPIFLRAGKLHYIPAAFRLPAILVLRFRKGKEKNV